MDASQQRVNYAVNHTQYNSPITLLISELNILQRDFQNTNEIMRRTYLHIPTK